MTRAQRTASVGILALREKLIKLGKIPEDRPLGCETMALLYAVAAMIDHALSEN